MPTTRDVVNRVLGEPLVLHSTSWRRDKGAVMLTFLAVVDADQVAAFDAEPVGRSDLARGDATSAPTAIGHGHGQVLEHALRHLAWLMKDDALVRTTLGQAWADALDGYTPEPFRALA